MKLQFGWLGRYFPDAMIIDRRERARSLLGAIIGVFLTGVLSQLVFGAHSPQPWLVASIGASAVLLFAVPASPLAQPWPLIGGNVISMLAGVVCAEFIGYPAAAASIAVGVAIAAMFMLRCVHPPGGALALSAALAGPAALQQGYGFVLLPIVLNSLLLLAAAVVYNNICGRRYPHFAHDHSNQHKTADARPTKRLGITPDDLDAVLKQYNQVLDISRDDLEEILLRTEMHAYQRRFGEVTCGDIMSRDVIKVGFDTDLQSAWRLLQAHRIKALPVVTRFNRVIGIVTLVDFIKHCEVDSVAGFSEKLRRFLQRAPHAHAELPEVVGQIMTTAVRTASAEQAIASLVPLFADTSRIICRLSTAASAWLASSPSRTWLPHCTARAWNNSSSYDPAHTRSYEAVLDCDATHCGISIIDTSGPLPVVEPSTRRLVWSPSRGSGPSCKPGPAVSENGIAADGNKVEDARREGKVTLDDLKHLLPAK